MRRPQAQSPPINAWFTLPPIVLLIQETGPFRRSRTAMNRAFADDMGFALSNLHPPAPPLGPRGRRLDARVPQACTYAL